MFKSNAFRPTLNSMEERTLMSATILAGPIEPAFSFYGSGVYKAQADASQVETGRIGGIAVDPSDPSAAGGITKLGSRRLILQGDGSYGDDQAAGAGGLTNGDTTSEGRRDLNDIYIFQSPTNPAGQPISGTANLVRFNSSTPDTSAIGDDVIVDGRIITGENHATASTHELGHALGFRHEHTRPEAQTQGDVIGGWGNDWISGGTGQDGTSANAGDPAPYQGKRSNGGYVPT